MLTDTTRWHRGGPYELSSASICRDHMATITADAVGRLFLSRPGSKSAPGHETFRF